MNLLEGIQNFSSPRKAFELYLPKKTYEMIEEITSYYKVTEEIFFSVLITNFYTSLDNTGELGMDIYFPDRKHIIDDQGTKPYMLSILEKDQLILGELKGYLEKNKYDLNYLLNYLINLSYDSLKDDQGVEKRYKERVSGIIDLIKSSDTELRIKNTKHSSLYYFLENNFNLEELIFKMLKDYSRLFLLKPLQLRGILLKLKKDEGLGSFSENDKNELDKKFESEFNKISDRIEKSKFIFDDDQIKIFTMVRKAHRKYFMFYYIYLMTSFSKDKNIRLDSGEISHEKNLLVFLFKLFVYRVVQHLKMLNKDSGSLHTFPVFKITYQLIHYFYRYSENEKDAMEIIERGVLQNDDDYFNDKNESEEYRNSSKFFFSNIVDHELNGENINGNKIFFRMESLDEKRVREIFYQVDKHLKSINCQFEDLIL